MERTLDLLLRHLTATSDKYTRTETHNRTTSFDLVHFLLGEDLKIAFELLQGLFGL